MTDDEEFGDRRRCMIFKPITSGKWPDPHRHPLNRRLDDGCDSCEKSLPYCHAMSPAECCPQCSHANAAATSAADVESDPFGTDRTANT